MKYKGKYTNNKIDIENLSVCVIFGEESSKKLISVVKSVDVCVIVGGHKKFLSRYYNKLSEKKIIMIPDRNLQPEYNHLLEKYNLDCIQLCISERNIKKGSYGLTQNKVDDYIQKHLPIKTHLIPMEFVLSKSTSDKMIKYPCQELLILDLLLWMKPAELHILGFDFRYTDKYIKEDYEYDSYNYSHSKTIMKFNQIVKNSNVNIILHTCYPELYSNDNVTVNFVLPKETKKILGTFNEIIDKKDKSELRNLLLQKLSNNELSLKTCISLAREWNL